MPGRIESTSFALATARFASAALAVSDQGRWVSPTAPAVEPGALAQRLAATRGTSARTRPGTLLRGFLVVPEGPGPFPAVVLVHARGPRSTA
jgi:hypothetical protein